MRVLAFGAHPDDWDEFAGGTMLRYAQAGHAVGVVSLTDGSGYGSGASAEDIARRRKGEFEAAATLLGNSRPYWPGFRDAHLVDDLETRIKVAAIIHDFQPDVVFTHPPDDYHPDHTAASQLVVDASFTAYILTAGTFFKNQDLGGDHATPARLSHPALYFYESEGGHGFLPDEYVDITPVWETKTRMMDCHRSQYEGDLNPRTGQPENGLQTDIEIIGRFRGMQAGVKYAEGFRLYHADGRVHPYRVLP